MFEANAIGRSFYEAYGFEPVDRRINEETGYPELRLRYEPDDLNRPAADRPARGRFRGLSGGGLAGGR